MLEYIGRRLLQMIPVLFGISLIVFFLIRIGGDPVRNIVPDYFTAEQVAQARAELGFDRPLIVQYWSFMSGAIKGDFGVSFYNRQPAWELVATRLPRTAQLAGAALLLAVLMSIPLGVAAALYRNTPVDLFVTTASVFGRSLPNFWLGLMLMLVFAVRLGWLPVSGAGEFSNRPFLSHLFLPALTLSLGLTTTLTRIIRSAVLEVIQEDHVRTARSKGAPEASVILRHVLRNALIPVVTVFGLQIGWLVGGAVVVEEVFAWPGMGRLMLSSILARDNTVVQAVLMLSALTIMLSNLAVDLLYTILDPRVRYA